MLQATDNLESASGKRKRGRPRLYPFDELKPGENFFIEGKKRDNIAPSMANAERRTGFVFHAVNEPSGVRVWRSQREELHRELKQQKAERRALRSRIKAEVGLGQ